MTVWITIIILLYDVQKLSFIAFTTSTKDYFHQYFKSYLQCSTLHSNDSKCKHDRVE